MKLVVVGAWVGLIAVALCGPETAAAQDKGGGAKVAYVNTQADPPRDSGIRHGGVDLHQGARDLPGRGAEATGGTRLVGAGFRAEVRRAVARRQRDAKRKELQGQQQKLEQRTQELQQRAADRERELLEPIQTKVNSIIEGIRAAGNYAMIFDVSAPNSGIVAADKSLDLTPTRHSAARSRHASRVTARPASPRRRSPTGRRPPAWRRGGAVARRRPAGPGRPRELSFAAGDRYAGELPRDQRGGGPGARVPGRPAAGCRARIVVADPYAALSRDAA